MPKKKKKLPNKKTASEKLDEFLKNSNIELSTVVEEVDNLKIDDGIYLINKPIIKVIAKYKKEI